MTAFENAKYSLQESGWQRWCATGMGGVIGSNTLESLRELEQALHELAARCHGVTYRLDDGPDAANKDSSIPLLRVQMIIEPRVQTTATLALGTHTSIDELR